MFLSWGAQATGLQYPAPIPACSTAPRLSGSVESLRWNLSEIKDNLNRFEPSLQTSDYDLPVRSSIEGYRTCYSSERGIASVYGIPGRDRFAGRRTASGEVMRPEKARAAILKSAGTQYPLGTWVRVSNGDKSMLICINDTGGGKRGRVIDLTSSVADAIDNGDLGEVVVECVLKPTKKRKCDDEVGALIEDQS